MYQYTIHNVFVNFKRSFSFYQLKFELKKNLLPSIKMSFHIHATRNNNKTNFKLTMFRHVIIIFKYTVSPIIQRTNNRWSKINCKV